MNGVPAATAVRDLASSCVTHTAVSSARSKAPRMAAEEVGMNGSETTA